MCRNISKGIAANSVNQNRIPKVSKPDVDLKLKRKNHTDWGGGVGLVFIINYQEFLLLTTITVIYIMCQILY